ncbi:MAG: hypothetical protein GY745_03615 [Actinomycetia bacterium]|nr:hypothetical protein [Actinomycetes bacterium]MCP4084134.1 hypothetical protein [Actinomycetes bacterium]
MAGVAYAVVRSDPPDVYLADDVDVLSRVLALQLVARTDPSSLVDGQAQSLRKALLDERWADAIVEWIGITGMEVDVYTHLHIYTDGELPADLLGAQLQFAPLFRG